MTPQLSRRIARALHAAQPELAVRLRVAKAIEKAESFESLPAWVKELVEDSEATLSGHRKKTGTLQLVLDRATSSPRR